jgi:hypothetical protein
MSIWRLLELLSESDTSSMPYVAQFPPSELIQFWSCSLALLSDAPYFLQVHHRLTEHSLYGSSQGP